MKRRRASKFLFDDVRTIGLTVGFVGPELVESDDPIRAFVDFEPKWSTGYGKTFLISENILADDFSDDPRYKASRLRLDKEYNEDDVAQYEASLMPEFWQPLLPTRLGEAVRKEIHSTSYTYSGSNFRNRVALLAYNGTLYGLGKNYHVDFAESVIEVPELANEKVAVAGGDISMLDDADE